MPVSGGRRERIAVPDAARPPRVWRGSEARVLIADPCPDTVTSLTWLLQYWGYAVTSASNGEAALEAARNYRPDVLLLELALPGLNGFDVVRRLRQDANSQPGAFVAVTGRGGEVIRNQAFDAGFDHYLIKPACLDHLQKLLATLTRSNRRTNHDVTADLFTPEPTA